MTDDIQPSDPKSRAVAVVASRLGVTEKAVRVLSEHNQLQKLGIDNKTIREIAGYTEQPQQHTQPPIVADEPDFDDELFDRLVAFGNGMTRAERVAIVKSKAWNGRARIDAETAQRILCAAKLSN